MLELGLMTPEPLRVRELTAGRVGYVITSQRDVRAAKIGDTLVLERDYQKSLSAASTDGSDVLTPLNAFREAKPMVFQGLFPQTGDDYEAQAAVERLTLNDPSVTTQTETSAALGPGFRSGFSGCFTRTCFISGSRRVRRGGDRDGADGAVQGGVSRRVLRGERLEPDAAGRRAVIAVSRRPQGRGFGSRRHLGADGRPPSCARTNTWARSWSSAWTGGARSWNTRT